MTGVLRVSRLGSRLLMFLLVAGLGCRQAGPPADEPVRPVKTMLVTEGEETRVRAFPGKVEAARKAELAFQVSGLLVKLPVKEGQKIAKGEVIAELRRDEFEARLKALQAQLDRARAVYRGMLSGERPEEQRRLEAQVRAARAKLENARTEYERADRLAKTGATSQRDLDRARALHQVAIEDYQSAQEILDKGTIARAEDIEAKQAEVRGLEARVVEAGIQLRDATLIAPYDGVVAQRFVEISQNVKAREPVVRFQDIEEIEVAVDVPEAVMAADLRLADIVHLQAEFSGAPGLPFPVQVREVAQVADPTTQTFRIRAAMAAPPPGVRLLPGMTATVTMTYRRSSLLEKRILVPVTAVAKDNAGRPIVWVIGADQKAMRRRVRVGEAAGSRIEVVEGLSPGERIAVAGVTFLREGMKVRDLGDALGGSPS